MFWEKNIYFKLEFFNYNNDFPYNPLFFIMLTHVSFNCAQ